MLYRCATLIFLLQLPALALAKDNFIDSTHYQLSSLVTQTATRFDQFFGEVDERNVPNKSYLRVTNSYNLVEGGDHVYHFRINAKAHLPAISKRLSLVFTADNEDDEELSLLDDQNEQIATNNLDANNDETQLDAALRYALDLRKRFRTDINVGFKSGFTPYIAARGRYRFQITETTGGYVRQTFYWREDQGYGSKTDLQFNFLLGEKMLLRWANDAEINNQQDYWRVGSSLTLFQTLDEKKSFAYKASINGQNKTEWQSTYYRFGIRYRQQFYRQWLYYEIEPAIAYSSDVDRNLTRTVGAALRLIFYFGNY